MVWNMFWRSEFLSHRLYRWLYENMIVPKVEVLGFSNSAVTIIYYSRVHISSNEVFSKILKKTSILQK